MKYKKEELEKYLFDDNLNYRQIGEIYKVSGVWIRKKALQLGIELQKKDRKHYYCLNCGKEIQRMAMCQYIVTINVKEIIREEII
jgi:hypothetical protein